MKKLVFAFCGLLVLCCCEKKVQKVESTDKVQKEEVKSQDPGVDVLTDEDGSIDSVYYDAEGRVVRISQTGVDVYGDKKEPVVDELTYNGIGKLQRTMHYEYRKNGNPDVSECLFGYTKEGRLYQVTFRKPWDKDKKETKTTFAYDRYGKLLNIVNDKRKCEFDYDKEGRMISQAIVDFDINNEKTKDDLWTYEYDSIGNCIKASGLITKNVGLANEDTIRNNYTFAYDQKGRCVAENDCGVDIQYSYNSKGVQVNYIVTTDGQPMTCAVKSSAKATRPHLYRLRSTEDFRQPFTINLDVISLTLAWFNENLTTTEK